MAREMECQALVVVDMQQDFFADTELERCRVDLVQHLNTLAARARDAGSRVIDVRTVHRPDRSTWTLNMLEDDQGMTIEGTPGASPVEGLDLGAADVVVKTRDSAFHGTSLRTILLDHGIETFALGGVSTESCIRATATDAFALDLRVTLVDRATASIDERLHREVLDLLEDQYRQPVVDPPDVVFAKCDAQGAIRHE